MNRVAVFRLNLKAWIFLREPKTRFNHEKATVLKVKNP